MQKLAQRRFDQFNDVLKVDCMRYNINGRIATKSKVTESKVENYDLSQAHKIFSNWQDMPRWLVPAGVVSSILRTLGLCTNLNCCEMSHDVPRYASRASTSARRTLYSYKRR